MENDSVAVEVAYAKADRQVVIELNMAEGTTAEQAIQASGILQQFPEIDLTKNKVGIFSKVRTLAQQLKEGDRVEIYRPLMQSPMQARRNRVLAK